MFCYSLCAVFYYYALYYYCYYHIFILYCEKWGDLFTSLLKKKRVCNQADRWTWTYRDSLATCGLYVNTSLNLVNSLLLAFYEIVYCERCRLRVSDMQTYHQANQWQHIQTCQDWERLINTAPFILFFSFFLNITLLYTDFYVNTLESRSKKNVTNSSVKEKLIVVCALL